MKKNTLLPLLVLLACNPSHQENTPNRPKLFVLSPEINSMMLREIEMNFISDSIVEFTPTLIATPFDYRTYKNDSSLKKEGYFARYSLKDSIFEVPDRNILTVVRKLPNGNLITKSGEILSTSSILDCKDTSEVLERVKRSLGDYKFLAPSYVVLLDESKRKKSPVTRKGNTFLMSH